MRPNPASAATACAKWRSLGWVFAAAAVSYGLFIWRTKFAVGQNVYFTLFDDAMISMRYARNLAEGHGLVWNPGEPPVEGFSNFLWILWMALIHLFPLHESKTSLVVMISGALLLLGNVVVTMRLAERVSKGSTFVVWAATILTAFYYPLAFWTLRGVEVGLLMLLINVGFLEYLCLRENFRILGFCRFLLISFLGSLVRADALIPFLVLTMFLTAGIPPGERKRALVLLAAAWALIVGLPPLARYAYFGDALPNTYYLKMSGAPAAVRIARAVRPGLFLLVRHLFLPLVFLSAWLCVRVLRRRSGERGRRPGIIAAGALIGAQIAYSTYVGGDAWEWTGFSNRFISVVCPLILLLSACAVEDLREWWANDRRFSAKLFFLGCAVLILLLSGVAVSVGADDPEYGEIFGVARLGLFQLAFLAGVCAIPHFTAPTPHGRRRAAGWVIAIFFLSLNAQPLYNWARYGATNSKLDEDWAREGMAVRAGTPAWISIAVKGAGNVSYFARRSAVDLLGKMDPVVARRARPGKFFPGHDKADVAYSVGELKPDLVLHYFSDPQALWFIRRAGYEMVNGRFYVRRDRSWDAEKLVEAFGRF